jgi:hypothetical protein
MGSSVGAWSLVPIRSPFGSSPSGWGFAGKRFNLLVRALGLTSMPDTQCGLKVFTAEVAHAVFPALITERFASHVEVLARAERIGARVV